MLGSNARVENGFGGGVALRRRQTLAWRALLAAGAVLALALGLFPGGSARAAGAHPAKKEASGSYFGQRIALSANGETALISQDTGKSEGYGVVWVFTRSGAVWTEQAKLTGTAAKAGADFGADLALSADGNTAIISGRKKGAPTGAAWVYTRSGSTWTQQSGPLYAGDASSEGGARVALSGNGEIALIAAPEESPGAVYVFARSGSKWQGQGDLTGAGEVGSGNFGTGLALSYEGDTALIGGERDNEGAGAAWVFTRSGSTWTQQGEKLAPPSGAKDFGGRVALSGDGNTALIDGSDGGESTWVYTRSGEAWAQQGEKLSGGTGLALSSDGSTALLGEGNAVRAYVRTGEEWTQQGEELTGGGEVGDGLFGHSIALSSNGNTALIGGQWDNERAGAVWLFTRSEGAWSQQGEKLAVSGLPAVSKVLPKKGTALGGTTVTITGTHLAGASTVWFGESAGAIVTDSGTSITVTSPDGTSGATVDITVTTPTGTSAINPHATFKYE
jgi:hypothetical protein